ncbi:hypothetical protein [Fusibacter bizertensis]
MSKKKKALEAQRKIIENRKLKYALCIGITLGLLIGLINGCVIGYTLRKRNSKDEKKRVEERAFYKARLGEIKHSLYQIKSRLVGDDLEINPNSLDETVAQVESEIESM